MACVNWLCTRNNPDVPPQDYLEWYYTTAKANYVCGQLEAGENGTPHIQFFVNFKKPGQRISALMKVDKHAHYEKVKVNNGADRYCMKEDTRLEGPYEFGTRPVQRNSKTDWDDVRKKAQAGDLESIPADIYVKHYRTLKEIKKDFMKVRLRETPRECWWYWGPAGTGKSSTALREHPEAYMKMLNKWWDGYQGERAVILDEFGKDHKVLGNHLKKWADPWIPFVAEAKGGALTPDYDHFIVTSNYSMEDIFGDDEQILEPLKRRFQVKHFGEHIYNRPNGGEGVEPPIDIIRQRKRVLE